MDAPTLNAESLLEPQLEDRGRRFRFLVDAERAATGLVKFAPTYLVNWMLWVLRARQDADWKVVEHPYVVAEGFITGELDRAEVAAQLDRCSHTLPALLAGKELDPTERFLAATAIVGLIAAGTSSPQTLGSLAVGCILDLDGSSERWAADLINLERHVELAEDNNAYERCGVPGCSRWALVDLSREEAKTAHPAHCREHRDARLIDDLSNPRNDISISATRALAFERMSQLPVEVALGRQLEIASPLRVTS